ncbi:DUF2278 family protein [Variovorax sp. LjRoot84]|uniref:DUF2278 family protein n=1 Tax=Variovorax sp. LjRoot84 TaxID=3342340 RepID=UPI003ECFC195
MTLKKYGVLKGTVTGHLRDADDDHYQILATAGNTVHRIAVNVKSSAPNAPSTLLFLAQSKLPEAFAQGLQRLKPGYTKLASRPGGLVLDYVRNKWFKPSAIKEVRPDAPVVNNDLKDKVEDAVVQPWAKSVHSFVPLVRSGARSKGRRTSSTSSSCPATGSSIFT